MGTAGSDSNGRSRSRGMVVKALLLLGGALLLKRLTKSPTRWDHARNVSNAFSAQKFSREQACRDPDNYVNFSFHMLIYDYVRYIVLFGGRQFGELLRSPSVRWRFLKMPSNFVQRFYMVKPCPKEMKCDVELSSYAIRDVEDYKNFCDRSKDQRPLPEEVLGDIAEHLTTIHLRQCERGKRCLYEGSTPPGSFPNSWNGASYSTSEFAVLRNNEIHMWDRGFDDDGNQVWGPKGGPYEFKPATALSLTDLFSPFNLSPQVGMEKRIGGSSVLQDDS
ncbi:hypothetical protein Sjap_023173 [Stephania japonica]|uniref:Chromophore lyase CRL, chloroplastic n=1 Tax=Stephania japonica TaxID=461633 RepID=A0AAP0EB36_9MAGN